MIGINLASYFLLINNLYLLSFFFVLYKQWSSLLEHSDKFSDMNKQKYLSLHSIITFIEFQMFFIILYIYITKICNVKFDSFWHLINYLFTLVYYQLSSVNFYKKKKKLPRLETHMHVVTILVIKLIINKQLQTTNK